MQRELDMGVPREEILSGLEKLLRRLGCPGTPERDGEVTRFVAPDGVIVQVGPMPEGRIDYPILFPRTLVVLSGEASALEQFHREMLHAFLRPTG